MLHYTIKENYYSIQSYLVIINANMFYLIKQPICMNSSNLFKYVFITPSFNC